MASFEEYNVKNRNITLGVGILLNVRQRILIMKLQAWRAMREKG
jgi:hypothetical protein